MKRLGVLLLGGLAAVVVFAGAPPASATDEPAEVVLTIENGRFSPEEITVKARATFVLVITNKDSGAEEFESRDLRIEKVIPAGKTVRLRMPALKAGTYSFVGEYHEQTARGRIIAE